MKIYQSTFLQVNYFENESLAEITWLSSTDNMTAEEYKLELLAVLEILSGYKYSKILVDESQQAFSTPPELQDWTKEHIYAKLPVVEVVAIVTPKGLILQLAAEQLADEYVSKNNSSDMRFFEKKEEALEWIRKDKN